MSAPVDVLAVIREHAESHRALAVSDAYSAQEAPRLEATLAAVAELIEVVDELTDWVDGVLPGLDGEEGGNSKLVAVRTALARIGGAA